MKRIIILSVICVCALFVTASFALEKSQVVGSWSLDLEKSQTAPDGNTAGLMKDVVIKDDGTFEALYGTKGTWKLADGKLLVTYANGGFRKDEEATMDATHLKFPSPAESKKFCYLKKK